MHNPTVRELLIASKVYIERTMPLLESGEGLPTDQMPRREDAYKMVVALRTAIAEIGQNKL